MALFGKSFYEFLGLSSSQESLERLDRYKETMFPLGEEQQKIILDRLQYTPKQCRSNRAFFLFMALKELWLKKESEGCLPVQCAEAMLKAALKYRMVPSANIPYILALVIEDLNLKNLEDMPSALDVTNLSLVLFPGKIGSPDWTQLPERNLNYGEAEEHV